MTKMLEKKEEVIQTEAIKVVTNFHMKKQNLIQKPIKSNSDEKHMFIVVMIAVIGVIAFICVQRCSSSINVAYSRNFIVENHIVKKEAA